MYFTAQTCASAIKNYKMNKKNLLLTPSTPSDHQETHHGIKHKGKKNSFASTPMMESKPTAIAKEARRVSPAPETRLHLLSVNTEPLLWHVVD